MELLQAWQTNQYVSGAVHGALYIKTRNAGRGESVKPKGVRYTPIGLSASPPAPHMESKSWIAAKAGSYRLLVDVVSKDGVRSYFETFKVVE